ncbi:hypothetical protein [Legionella sainthelensi]|uniref:hypothetical protein n=1 Tax=Legionella sainthelensi TaxID=28087 RepID=UPI001356C1F7|nr:hypothetical protein [Legionella sainthelensi]
MIIGSIFTNKETFWGALDKNSIKAKFITIENADHGMNGQVDEVKEIVVNYS